MAPIAHAGEHEADEHPPEDLGQKCLRVAGGDGGRCRRRVLHRGARYCGEPMPQRATKRGERPDAARRRVRRADLRGELRRACRARELAGSGARVLIVDRYEIGERQTSACAAPTEWLEAHGRRRRRSARPSTTLVIHTPARGRRASSSVDLLDLRLPRAVRAAVRAVRRRVRDGQGRRPRSRRTAVAHRPRRPVRPARRRRLGLAAGAGAATVPAARRAALARARGSPRTVPPTSSRSGSTAATCPAGYGWSFPARDEVRIGVGSFDPRFHVKEPTVRLAEDLDADGGPLPGQLDPPQAARRDRGRRSSSSATPRATACR